MTAIVIGAGFAGLSAAVRMTKRRRARPRARSAGASRWARDGLSRSRNRRGRRQRSARAARVLHRDVRVPPGDERPRTRPHAAAARGDDDRSRRASARASCARRCRRRCTCSRACSSGTRSTGGTSCAALRMATPLGHRAPPAERGPRHRGVARRNRRRLARAQRADRRGCARCSGIRWRWPR